MLTVLRSIALLDGTFSKVRNMNQKHEKSTDHSAVHQLEHTDHRTSTIKNEDLKAKDWIRRG